MHFFLELMHAGFTSLKSAAKDCHLKHKKCFSKPYNNFFIVLREKKTVLKFGMPFRCHRSKHCNFFFFFRTSKMALEPQHAEG